MSITDNLRDAAYIAIGMGVIGVQRAQVRREELRKQFDTAIKEAETRITPLVEEVKSRVFSA